MIQADLNQTIIHSLNQVDESKTPKQYMLIICKLYRQTCLKPLTICALMLFPMGFLCKICFDSLTKVVLMCVCFTKILRSCSGRLFAIFIS